MPSSLGNRRAPGGVHQPYTQLYLHLVWATWDRLPLVRPAFREAIYGCIQDQLRKHRCDVIAICGTEDHVHVFTRSPTTVAIADVVKHSNGASSTLMTQTAAPGEFFKVAGLRRRVHARETARAARPRR